MKIDRATRERSVQKRRTGRALSLPHVNMAVAMRQQKKNVDNFISANLFALLRTLRQAPLNSMKRSEYQMLSQLQTYGKPPTEATWEKMEHNSEVYSRNFMFIIHLLKFHIFGWFFPSALSSLLLSRFQPRWTRRKVVEKKNSTEFASRKMGKEVSAASTSSQ